MGWRIVARKDGGGKDRARPRVRGARSRRLIYTATLRIVTTTREDLASVMLIIESNYLTFLINLSVVH